MNGRWSLAATLLTLLVLGAAGCRGPDGTFEARAVSKPVVLELPPAALPPVTRAVTYEVRTNGTVHSDPAAFAAVTAATFADGRGWRASGIELRQVDAGGDFTLWLSAAALVPGFDRNGGCDPNYSCRVGRDVVINDDRFTGGSPTWPGSIDDYRAMVVNHEVGHFLGLDHVGCPAPGGPAPLMMQQSKSLDGCTPNAWPTVGEREVVAG